MRLTLNVGQRGRKTISMDLEILLFSLNSLFFRRIWRIESLLFFIKWTTGMIVSCVEYYSIQSFRNWKNSDMDGLKEKCMDENRKRKWGGKIWYLRLSQKCVFIGVSEGKEESKECKKLKGKTTARVVINFNGRCHVWIAIKLAAINRSGVSPTRTQPEPDFA